MENLCFDNSFSVGSQGALRGNLSCAAQGQENSGVLCCAFSERSHPND